MGVIFMKIKFSIKIILSLIILTFFLPFFVISCDEQELSVSGFETAFGKSINNLRIQDGNPATLVLIIPNIIILIILLYKIKKEPGSSVIFKYALIFTPIFNISAAFTTRTIVRRMFDSRLAGYIRIGLEPGLVNMRLGYGIILYILLNIALLALACVNFFADRKREIKTGDSQTPQI